MVLGRNLFFRRGKMQSVINQATKPRSLRESMMTVPKAIYGTKVLNTDLETDSGYRSDFSADSLSNMLSKQHPLIFTWLILSCISICFLSAWLFVLS